MYVCMDGYRQDCMCVVHTYIYIHACIQNVIPGIMFFSQGIHE